MRTHHYPILPWIVFVLAFALVLLASWNAIASLPSYPVFAL